jgi:hypothetical protein
VFVDSVAQYPHILIFVRRSFRPGSFNTRFVENEALNGFVLQKKFARRFAAALCRLTL